MRKDETGDVWIALGIGAIVGAIGQYANDVRSNISSGATGVDIFARASSGRDYLASAIGGAIAATPGLSWMGTVVAGATGNIITSAIKNQLKTDKDIAISAAKGGVANLAGHVASKGVAVLKVKNIKCMTRTQQKNYINRKIYRGTQANINVNYSTYNSQTTRGKISILESKLPVFKSGIYSTFTSTLAGLFGR